MSGSGFAQIAAKHFVENAPTGILNNLNQNHIQPIANRITPHSQRLMDHLKTRIEAVKGGSTGSGGSLYTGGHIGDAVTSGGFLPAPKNHKDMYHHLLNLSPQQFEAYRETATQLLGGVPSPMWDKIVDSKEPLEADPKEYEEIINMPNQHAAAKMVESDASSPTGGGFWKALKHVGRKVTNLYKGSRGALKFVDRNKDLLLELPGIRDYKENISGFLETANALDETLNPLVDAAIDATNTGNLSYESKQKLKRVAEKGLDQAINNYVPEARKYVDMAKDAANTVQQIQYRTKRQSYNIPNQ